MPQGGIEDVGHRRENSLRRMAEVERETGEVIYTKDGRVGGAKEHCDPLMWLKQNTMRFGDWSMVSCVKSKRLERDEVQRGQDGLDGQI